MKSIPVSIKGMHIISVDDVGISSLVKLTIKYNKPKPRNKPPPSKFFLKAVIVNINAIVPGINEYRKLPNVNPCKNVFIINK